ncbi:methyltransferase [Alteromonas ponticola]|uniref:tRNA1(Val) (adenine(37)-N6)-methyltransferase n=1 Tax=Alteromonas aquimaris TaxID=2998417 RepID=A0ABT3PA50_9ALTE|nr:methyltransferase [Alteromonas aquimaris]MCW8109658.1 methyltransferase [Alteromonas aquimaris]
MATKRSVFACKQFVVEQHHCAMKVNTDSLILGSWASPASVTGPILDIGTGSGILALMMAQKSQMSSVYAIEIDPDAAQQADKNFAASPWSKRMNVILMDIAQFTPTQHYATIIANPPYFAAPISSSRAYIQLNRHRERARIDHGLSISTLFHWVAKHLIKNGYFYCLYPAAREAEILSMAKTVNLVCDELLTVRHSEEKPAHVVAFKFSQSEKRVTEYLINRQTLVIRNQQAQYSSEFKTLCRDFYLHF